jgi:Holliday junction resolvase RusA-like endonuclease
VSAVARVEPVAGWLISLPPSTNNLYANTPHGRRKTPEYRQWLREAGWQLRAQIAQPVAGKTFALSIAAPLTRRRDLGNCLKATEDLLVELGLLPDDRWIEPRHAKGE